MAQRRSGTVAQRRRDEGTKGRRDGEMKGLRDGVTEGRRDEELSHQLEEFWGQKFPLLFLRRGGQTTKSSDVQKCKCSGRGGVS